MKRSILSIISVFLLLAGVIPLLVLGTVPASADPATPSTVTFEGGSLTTVNTNAWGTTTGSYATHFDVDAGPLTVEYLGVNAYPINYTGDFGWPPDPTDTGASVLVGVGDGVNAAQYSFKSNMYGSYPREVDPLTKGKGVWNQQSTGHWNEDGYRSWLFQGQFTGHYAATVGNSQYNAEKYGGPNGDDPDYDTFDLKMTFEEIADGQYKVTGWHRMWKSSAIDEGCYWDWNYAMNAHDPAKRDYLKMYEGSWTADGGLDLSDVRVFLGIQNWATDQPTLHSFDWDSVIATGVLAAPSAVVPIITANDKVYDGTTAATLSSQTLLGVQPGEDVSLVVGDANFDNANAGMGKTVTATGLSLAGADAGNYYLASDTAATTANIIEANTTVKLVSSMNPGSFLGSILGQRIVFTAAAYPVLPGAGTPTGTVTFKDGNKVLATVPLVGGKATLKIGAHELGWSKHCMTAVYSGDANFESSTSPVLLETVNLI